MIKLDNRIINLIEKRETDLGTALAWNEMKGIYGH